MYSAVPTNQASNDRLERINSLQEYFSVQEHNNLFAIERPNFITSIPLVRAAGYIHVNSTTEVISANKLLEKNALFTHSTIDIIETAGRLYCTNKPENTSWLKIITLATDSQSYNVLLTINNGGVMLRTIRDIAPGEPLLLWFANCILQALNIPFIHPLNCNFQGSVYTCHICNSRFEYPNPLKLHLALDCSRIDNSYIWTLLASKIIGVPLSEEINLSFDHYPGRNLELNLNPLSISRRITFPITPYLSHNLDTNCTLRNDSSSSNQALSRSLNDVSSVSSHFLPRNLPSSSVRDMSAENHLINRSTHTSRAYRIHRNRMMCYNISSRQNLEIDSKEINLAQLERIASDIGKCSAGYKCIFCDKIYSRKYGLRIHIRTHNGYKPLYCKICGRRFGDPSNLNKHSRLHATDNSPYKCDVCNKILVRRRDLERHISSWHSEKGENNILGSSSSGSDDGD